MNLIFISGPMGVGKSRVSRVLKDQLPDTFCLDGDWLWDMNPFVINDDTLSLVKENIVNVLQNVIDSNLFQNVIFTWVMQEQSIIDSILDEIKMPNVHFISVSLICDKDTLIQRIVNDGRKARSVEGSLAYIPLFKDVNSIKIDTSKLTVDETCAQIIDIVNDK